MDRTDVFVSGAGIAGLVAAAAFAARGFTVAVADPAPPVRDADADGSDLRSTAYLRPATDLFRDAGLWDALAPAATPLRALRVAESRGDPPALVADRLFDASDLGPEPFGWNVPNWLARKTLADRLAGDDRVDLRLGTGVRDVLPRDREAVVTLAGGARIAARLVVAADGRGSPVREGAGIPVRTTRYGQSALAFVAAHDLPHDDVSTEIYRSGGAFTLVPLADRDGRAHSAVVWMEDAAEAARLSALDDAAFDAALQARSCGVLGTIGRVSPVRTWPVVTQEARRLTARRTALVAEAAHVLPPIGAQGLNTSLADVAALVRIAAEAPGDLGGAAMLDRYERARAADVHARATVIDAFNRLCRSGDPLRSALRATGLALVHDLAPLRLSLMRAGLGGA